MTRSSPRDRVIELFEHDPLLHIVGAKMLSHVGAAADVVLREGESGWAALITFASSASEYDKQNYDADALIAVLEGTSCSLQIGLVDELGLRRGEGREVVLKTRDAGVARLARERFDAQPVAAFVSFTTSERRAASAALECATSTVLTPALSATFERNGYRRAELARHFAAGARWFSIEQEGAVEAACFVFKNFGRVWEIAGVHTEPSRRRRGLATHVVEAALSHLLAVGALPRYQTSAANEASLALARHVGLNEFLRIEHLKIERRA